MNAIESSENDRDCLKCKYVPCVNLYDVVEERGETWLGEIRMLEKFSNPFAEDREYKLHPPCLLGVGVFTLCKLLGALWESHEERYGDRDRMLPSTPFYMQGVRDLKAAILLILTGHYRTAGAIMRSVLELYLAGLYFDYRYMKASDDRERDKIFQEVRQYVNTGEYVIPAEYKKYKKDKRDELNYAFLKNFLTDKKVFKNFDSIEKLWGLLNGYIHPKKFELPKKGYPLCAAMVSYVKEDYEECLRLFQVLLAVLLNDIMWNIYYEKIQFINTEKMMKAAESVKSLKAAEKELKGVIDKAIYSDKLRSFINNKLLKILDSNNQKDA